ncbi:eukaryotic translation initiation factor 4 gamma 3-like [Takifugu rubripes]|uniref:eukaryotic translation initiation factor 4 gamma 3-like n=1 Tax=Takifugu rubripes TaxID=31033 RepID=UPI00114599B7|nr:eukaryotic translation initiation factor 4 gamma 3-like [Takifugu rubripes]
MSTNSYRAGQVPSIRSSQCGGEGHGRTEGMTENLIRTFRGILNKLTPERFESLMKQVDELNINNEETLNAVVELIVNKALSEQSYSATYAKMCHHLKGLMVSSRSSDGFVYFHNLLLKRCQMEFENGLLKEKETNVSVAQEEGEQQQLKVDLEQTKLKTRVRSVANMRFIGELFKQRMITEAIIHTCAVKLLQDVCEESMECLCKLLSMVGKDLDTETERPKLNSYYDYIFYLLKEWKMSTRIKFMLQDVVALRKNNWVPHKKDDGPKTLQQLHQEVKQAEEREQSQFKKGQNAIQQRGRGRSADRGQSFNVKDCDGDRKQRNHLGSSSTFEMSWRPKEREPVMFLNEQNRGTQIRSVSKITVEHKTTPKGGSLSKPLSALIAKEEAQAQDCNEEEVYQALKRLLQNSVNDKIEEWIQNTLNDRQRSSEGFVRALMRAVCQSVIVDCGVYTLNTYELLERVSLLKRYITDGQKQLVALNVLQQLVVHIDQPDGLLRMFFDVLSDEEVVQDETFFKWKTSPVNVISVSNFFTMLQEANKWTN